MLKFVTFSLVSLRIHKFVVLKHSKRLESLVVAFLELVKHCLAVDAGWILDTHLLRRGVA